MSGHEHMTFPNGAERHFAVFSGLDLQEATGTLLADGVECLLNPKGSKIHSRELSKAIPPDLR